MSSGMVILVGMSSIKFLEKTEASKEKAAHTRSPFSSAPFCQRDLMYPLYIGPQRAEFSKCLDAVTMATAQNPGNLGEIK